MIKVSGYHAGSNGHRRVLVVEDEAIVAADIQNTLENMGYIVLGRAATGEEAVRKTSSLRPDLVLMDVKLKGDMDGIRAGIEIRALYNTPIIYLTAYSDPFLEGKSMGFLMPRNPVLSKPFDADELGQAIDICLNGRASAAHGVRQS
jgi:two-component system, response regulator PdtaR